MSADGTPVCEIEGAILRARGHASVEERIFTGVVATGKVDCYGRCIQPLGAKFDLPLPLLLEHRREVPIGEIIDAKVAIEGIEITARLFALRFPSEIKDYVDAAWESIKRGQVSGLSPGFNYMPRDTVTDDGVIYVYEWNLDEVSVVAAPADEAARIKKIHAFASKGAGMQAGNAVPPGAAREAASIGPRALTPRDRDVLKAGARELAYTLKNIVRDEFDFLFKRIEHLEKSVKKMPRWVSESSLYQSHPQDSLCEFDGGVLRAFRDTTPLLPTGARYETLTTAQLSAAGWKVLVAGIADLEVEHDAGRGGLVVRAKMTGGRVIEKRCEIPTIRDRGVFKHGETYAKGDGVTWGGSFWIAQKETMTQPDAPEPTGYWRLAVRKGRDGKNGERGRDGHGSNP